MLKIGDKIFKKDEIVFIEKLDNHMSQYWINVHLKNETCVTVSFNDRDIRNKNFDGLVKKVDDDK